MRSRLYRKKLNKKLLIFLIIFLSILLLIAIILVFQRPLRRLWDQVFPRETVPDTLEGPYDIAYVYDGDTISVLIGKEEVTVRMIGIDTPESVNRDKSKNTPEGMEASLWLHDYLKGRSVWLEYDEQRTDRYGRVLAYVWLDEGNTMLEDEILKNGLAVTLQMDPNNRWSLHFEDLEKQAKKENAGFWGTGFFK